MSHPIVEVTKVVDGPMAEWRSNDDPQAPPLVVIGVGFTSLGFTTIHSIRLSAPGTRVLVDKLIAALRSAE